MNDSDGTSMSAHLMEAVMNRSRHVLGIVYRSGLGRGITSCNTIEREKFEETCVTAGKSWNRMS